MKKWYGSEDIEHFPMNGVKQRRNWSKAIEGYWNAPCKVSYSSD